MSIQQISKDIGSGGITPSTSDPLDKFKQKQFQIYNMARDIKEGKSTPTTS